MLLEHKDEITGYIYDDTEEWRSENKSRQTASHVMEGAVLLNRPAGKDEPTALGSPMQSPHLFDNLPSPALHSPMKMPPIGFFNTSPVRQTDTLGRAKK